MIVITGGAGMIGSIVARALNCQGRDDLVIADRPDGPGQLGNLARRRIALRLDRDALFDWLAGERSVEAVVHMGAISDTSVDDARLLDQCNVLYSQQLWRWCVREGVPFYYASSAATYGDGRQGYADTLDPRRLTPLNRYAESKNRFDAWVAGQVEDGAPCPPRWAGFKFFNVYGPNEYHKGRMASMVWQSFRQLRDSGSVRLFFVPDGKGRRIEARRDFIHVDDAVAVVCHFVANAVPSGLYNVGSGQARRFSELVAAVGEAMGSAPGIDWTPLPEEFHGRYQMLTEAPIGRLRAAGFDRPMRGIEEGVADYIRGYLLCDERYA
jgi:ADP-L-glycero-D-manno-heptose 6-epimerase